MAGATSIQTPKLWRYGQATFTLTSATQSVVFDEPLPASTYKVFFTTPSGLPIGMPTASAPTQTGFTITLPALIAATVEFLAIIMT